MGKTTVVKWAITLFTLALLIICRPPAKGVTQSAADFAAEQKLAELSRQISGRESEPAEKVFKNIRKLQGIEAARLLRAMNSWGRALGVTCMHCHVLDQWERDDRPAKQIAREMVGLTRTVSNDLLKNIESLQGRTPAVTCTT
jgi:hypothetical protein